MENVGPDFVTPDWGVEHPHPALSCSLQTPLEPTRLTLTFKLKADLSLEGCFLLLSLPPPTAYAGLLPGSGPKPLGRTYKEM